MARFLLLTPKGKLPILVNLDMATTIKPFADGSKVYFSEEQGMTERFIEVEQTPDEIMARAGHGRLE